ncbi:MAG TPA: DUF2339 domain-containing protein [Vicinamibacterales bacterium]|nr:DUF2339 domain-containing protein [Vicinamibacterales bacterium]
MNFALLALAVAVGVFVLTVVVPIATFLRVRKTVGDISRIDRRLDELETELRRLQLAARRAEPAGQAAPAVSPAAPALPAETLAPAASAAPVKPAEFRRPVEAPVPAPAPPKAPATGLDESLESRIGGRWLLYIGTAALVIGIGFFVKYAFDNDWIGETGRVLIGAAIGLAMILGGHRIARRGYPLYGQIVAGGGFATLYISVFAALAFYGLIGRPAAFGLMVLVTAGAALAADAHRSLGLALFAAAGGFLTPFLVGGGENAQIVLLSYDAILVMGTMVMASRRNWPILNVVSYAFVLGTFASWADSYYTPAQWVPTQVFLTIFGALFTGAGLRAHRTGSGSAGMVGVLLVTAPIIFHAASVANLQPHWMALLLYLTLASVTGVAASMKLDSAWLRLAVFAFVAPVLWRWIGEHAGPGWLLAPAAVALAIYAMNLVAIGERLARQSGRWLKADLVLFHGSALGLFAGLYAIFDPVATSSMPLLALALAAWHGVLTWFWRGTSEEAGLNSLAVAFAMLGFAIGLQFDLWWSVVGWAIEAAAIVWVGLKSRRDWMRLGGALLLAWSVLLLVRLGFFVAPAGFSPVFNARVGATLAVVAVCYVLALLHQRYAGRVPDRAGSEIAALYLLGNVLTIVLLTTEISFYWQMREATDATARLARSASVAVAWAVYGTLLIVAGIVRRYAPIRYLAIALLAMTIVKAFAFDLSMLGGIYRIIGFVGLGVFLLLGAWLYQRYRDVILGRD